MFLSVSAEWVPCKGTGLRLVMVMALQGRDLGKQYVATSVKIKSDTQKQ